MKCRCLNVLRAMVWPATENPKASLCSNKKSVSSYCIPWESLRCCGAGTRYGLLWCRYQLRGLDLSAAVRLGRSTSPSLPSG